MSVSRAIDDLERRLDRLESQIPKVNCRASQSVGGGGGGEGWAPYEAASPELLQEGVPDSSLGYINAGAYEGAWYSRLGGVWRGLNVWESP
jgi:hypothetical protein